MVLTKKLPYAFIFDVKIGSTPFTTVDALDASGRSGRFLGTPYYSLRNEDVGHGGLVCKFKSKYSGCFLVSEVYWTLFGF